jgi:hypothetical protein
VDPSSTFAETGANSEANCSTYDITRDIPVWELLDSVPSVSAS